MRFLVDTNIFLDFFFQRENGFDEAKKFFIGCYKEKHQIYVSSMSLRDIGYVAHRITHNSNIARDIQLKTYSLATKVCGISADAAIDALYSDNSDYEDSLQIVAAQEILADAIITNDKTGFKKCRGIKVFDIEEINKYMPKRVVI